MSEKLAVDNARFTGLGYDSWVAKMRERFAANMNEHQLFKTMALNLYDIYLGIFKDAGMRQYHTCKNCRDFIERYGDLVYITSDGQVVSAIWDHNDTEGIYAEVASIMKAAAEGFKVDRPFYADESELGRAKTGEWTHFAVGVPPLKVSKNPRLNGDQLAAYMVVHYDSVSKMLTEHTVDRLEETITLLKSGVLKESNKVLPIVEWFHDLKVKTEANKKARRNLLWRAVAMAPTGFTSLRSSTAGMLLDAIATGTPMEIIKNRFAKATDPLTRQRPTEAPSDGQIKETEKLIEKLGLARSLERRFARFEEMQTFWTPPAQVEQPKKSGIFSHMLSTNKEPQAKKVERVGEMTWIQFQSEHLPGAKKLEFNVPYGNANFVGLLTAVHMDAPPIFQWDDAEARNPVSWYVVHSGSSAHEWSLPPGRWVNITGLSFLPSTWNGDKCPHHGNGLIVHLEGAISKKTRGSALFPSCLKSELHGVRATIEHFSRTAPVAGAEEGTANGYLFSKQHPYAFEVKVNDQFIYKIDRWY